VLWWNADQPASWHNSTKSYQWQLKCRCSLTSCPGLYLAMETARIQRRKDDNNNWQDLHFNSSKIRIIVLFIETVESWTEWLHNNKERKQRVWNTQQHNDVIQVKYQIVSYVQLRTYIIMKEFSNQDLREVGTDYDYIERTFACRRLINNIIFRTREYFIKKASWWLNT